MKLSEDFHALLRNGAWLQELVADFAEHAQSATRRDALRLKSWLHLSLAYNFLSEQHEALASLARRLVDPAADVGWELRFYQRHADGAWTCHASWSLEDA